MPVIPYVWSGLSREARRRIVREEEEHGNTVAWVRLTANSDGPVLDVVDISGQTTTYGAGILGVQPNLRLKVQALLPWQVLNMPDRFACFEQFMRLDAGGAQHHYHCRVLMPNGYDTRVSQQTVSAELKKLIEIDIRGITQPS